MKIPALRRAAVFIPVDTKFAGTARFQIVASSDDFSDAAEISLPVWTPATTEAFASTYWSYNANGMSANVML